MFEDLCEEFEMYDSDIWCKRNSYMTSTKTFEINGGREETRVAKVCNNADWLKLNHKGWDLIQSYGMVERTFKTKDKTSIERHYYISSLENLTPEKLLEYTRKEWSVESMHWQLDVFYKEDVCTMRTREGQIMMNLFKKIALNILSDLKSNHKKYQSKTQIMRDFANNPSVLLQNCF